MNRVIMVLNKYLDEPVGRNEKILSRIHNLKENKWQVDVFVVKEKKIHINIIRIALVIFKTFIISLKIVLHKRKYEHLVIWTMNAPSYLHIPGIITKKLIKFVYWVAEFRDAMCEEPFYSRKPPATRLLNRLLEVLVMKTADRILKGKGSQCSFEYFKRKYPEEIKKIFETEYQGYNKSIIDSISPRNFDKFTITYAGRLYDGWIEPIYFLKGFSKFIQKYQLSSENVQVMFYVKGWREEYSKLIDYLQLNSFIQVHGYVSTTEIISILKGSNLLLYINGSSKTNKEMIHSKFWNYIGSRKPLLVLSKEGFEISNLVEKYHLGFLANENDTKEISKKLGEAFEDSNLKYHHEDEINRLFTREKRNKVILKILNDLIK